MRLSLLGSRYQNTEGQLKHVDSSVCALCLEMHRPWIFSSRRREEGNEKKKGKKKGYSNEEKKGGGRKENGGMEGGEKDLKH